MLKRICLLILFLCGLSGCGEDGVDPKAISEYYSGLQAVTVEADIVVNSGTLAEYGVLFTRTAEEGDRVEILSPESLAGIRASILPDKAQIEYDGMALETLLPGISGFVPADALSGVLNDLAEGVPEYYGEEKLGQQPAVVLSYLREFEGMTARKLIWVDRRDHRLLRAEFYLDEQMILEVLAESFVA